MKKNEKVMVNMLYLGFKSFPGESMIL